MKIPKILKNFRIWILLVALLLALVAIQPSPWVDGVTVRSVVVGSAAADAGFVSPKAQASPLSKERIISIDNSKITSLDDFTKATSKIKLNQTLHIRTNKQIYTLKV